MVAPCKEDGDDTCGNKPPFLAAAAEDEAEDEKEDGYRSHIHRTGSEWLRSPVKRQVLHCLLEVWLTGTFQELSGL